MKDVVTTKKVRIRRIGNSRGILLPKPLLKAMGLLAEDTMDLIVVNKESIMLRKSEPVRYCLDELLPQERGDET